MEKVYKVIAYLNANSKTYQNEKKNFELTNDNGVESISYWNVDGLVQPNDTQLDALESEATTIKTNLLNEPNTMKTNRTNAINKIKTAASLTDEEVEALWH